MNILEEIGLELSENLRGIVEPYECFIFLFKILAWKKLSDEKKIEDELSFENLLESEFDLKQVKHIFESLDKELPYFDHYYSDIIQNKEIFLRFINKVSNIKNIDSSVYMEFLKILPKFSRGRISTPFELSELIGKISGVNKDDEVYIPFVTSYEFPFYINQTFKSKCYLETFVREPLPNLLKILLDSDINIESTNPIRNPKNTKNNFSLKKFDVTLSVPPFGLPNFKDLKMDIFSRFPEDTLKSDVAFYYHIISQTSKKAVIVSPVSFLFKSTKDEYNLKRYLIDNNILESVIALPQNIFHNANVNTAIVILNFNKKDDNVLFIDAKSDKFYTSDSKSRKNIISNYDEIVKIYDDKTTNVGISSLISNDEIKEKDFNLVVEQYVIDSEKLKEQNLLNNITTKKLSEISQIQRSQNIEDEGEGEDFYEISTPDLSGYGYINSHSREKKVNKNTNTAKKYKLEPLDILLVVKGNIGKVGLVAKNIGKNYIANQLLQVIRLEDEKQAIPLFMFLKSDIGQNKLKQLSVGATISQIQTSSLKELEVPFLTLKQIKKVEEAFNKEIELYKKIDSIKEEIEKINTKFIEIIDNK